MQLFSKEEIKRNKNKQMNDAKRRNDEFIKMLNELELVPELYSPSPFWQILNASHKKLLYTEGLQNFKRSINKEYFDWGVYDIFYHQLSPIILQLRKGNIRPIIKSSFIDLKPKQKAFNKLERLSKLIYRIYVAYLYDYVLKIDSLGILNKISEPSFGAPLLVAYRDRLISQDLCNSVHEFYSITEGLNTDLNLEIAELGAGYGRLAYVFLKTLPKINYCIIDIPPALYIAQQYLRKVFPKEKFFFFRHFNNSKRIEKDFANARIRFLMPHQIEYLPKDFFDIVITISSLQEMRRDQIENYIKQFDRLSKGLVYLKQWRKSKAKDNNFIQEDEYPIPTKWKKMYHRQHPIQHMFFESLFKTRA